jgi:hypothetical protein
LFLHLLTSVHIVWATFPPFPTPHFRAEPVLPSCSPILLKRSLFLS